MSSSTAAELSSIADALGRYEQRVAGLATPYLGSDREDLLAALYEVERILRQAGRHCERAARIARSS